MALVEILFFIQLYKGCAEVIFRREAEGRSVELSCPITEPSMTHLHLYLRVPDTQTTLLSLSRDAAPRVSPKHRGRLRLSGGLHSPHLNVTVLDLETGDTGLYLWEKTENNGSRHILSDLRLLLLVQSSETLCRCSSVYPPLLLTLSAAAGLVLIVISWIGLTNTVKSKQRERQHAAPIYVEMDRKEQTAVLDVPEPPSHLEEARFPVYANQHYRAPNENHYACPRQTGLKAAWL